MRRWIVATVLMVLAVGLAQAGPWWPDSFPPLAHEEEPNSPENCGACQKAGENGATHVSSGWFFTEDQIIAFGTVVIAVFTVVLGVGTGFLVIDGRRHSRHALRAYLGTQTIALAENLAAGARPLLQFRVVNSGQTPAYKVKNWVEVDVRPNPNPGTFGDLDFTPERRVLNTQEFFNAVSEMDSSLTKEQVAGMRDDTMRLYLWGRVEFNDAFGRPRWITYRAFFHPRLRMMASAPEGNDAN